MKKLSNYLESLIFFALTGSVCLTLQAQKLEKEPTPQTHQALKPTPKLQVLQTLTHNKNGRAITVKRVQCLATFEQQPIQTKTHSQKKIPHDLVDQVSRSFVIQTQTVSDVGSLITWWETGVEQPVQCQAWSNLDWKLFEATSTIEAGDTKYHFLLFSETKDMQALGLKTLRLKNPKIPLLSDPDTGASYKLLESSPTNDSALNFLAALHHHYDREKVKLKAARAASMEKAALSQIRPKAKKKDLILNFWNLEPSQKELK